MPPSHSSGIDPAKLPTKAIADAAEHVLDGEPDTRIAVAAFLTALMEDDEAMWRSWLGLTRAEPWIEGETENACRTRWMRAALLAAVQETR